jgi:hypothetical protein
MKKKYIYLLPFPPERNGLKTKQTNLKKQNKTGYPIIFIGLANFYLTQRTQTTS